MPLHRVIDIGAFTPPDPAWEILQQRPDSALFTESIRTDKPGKLLWWAIGYDGDGANARPVAGSLTSNLNARVVIAQPGARGPVTEYIGLSSIVETDGSELIWGRAAVEVDWPDTEAWLQVISLAAGTSAATHLHISYKFIPQDL